jgi:hypothetical protein
MGYDESDFVPCEVIGCEMRGSWIHHIDCRGMGGSKQKDFIENLMSICAHHDEKYGDRKQYMDFLKYCHIKRLKERQVKYNPELIKTEYHVL